jgi:hypothetical protein
MPSETVIVCIHLINAKFQSCIFSQIFNKTPLKFPIPRVWVMFPKSWKKSLLPELYGTGLEIEEFHIVLKKGEILPAYKNT